MPVLGEKNFEDAVTKVMKESNVDRESAQRIVGSQEKKARLLKLRIGAIGINFPNKPPRKIPRGEDFEPTRPENPLSPKRKAIPFGKKPTARKNRTQQLDRMEAESAINAGVADKIRPPKVTQADRRQIISAKEHNHAIIFKSIESSQYKRASLDSSQGHYAKYWLLNAKQTNGNGWGVSQQSIAKNIHKFVGKPFVVTAKQWFANSEYGDSFEHPYLPTNDINVVMAHQEKFRVGTIRDVFENNGDYFASVEMDQKFANMILPPFCSPAIFQNDPFEPEGAIADWEALHLAGLMESPAYGIQVALLRGTCMGGADACRIQFKGAKLAETICPKKLSKLRKRLGKITKGNTTFNRLAPEDIADIEDINKNVKPPKGTKPRGKFKFIEKGRAKEILARLASLGEQNMTFQDSKNMKIHKKKNAEKSIKERMGALHSPKQKLNPIGKKKKKKKQKDSKLKVKKKVKYK